jgi:dihydrofolate reductase
MAETRRIVMFNRVTADGYFAGPDGNLDWVVPDDEIDKAGAQATSGFDTVLFGRRTYQQFESFWPHALDDASTAADPHSARRRSPEIRAMATMLNEATKLVFSRTLKSVAWKNSRLIPELEPREIEVLKKRPGKDMIVFGSGSVVSQLTQHGLIDEYQFVVTPILLGSGRPLISNVPKASKLDLLEARPQRSGNVVLRYARPR